MQNFSWCIVLTKEEAQSLLKELHQIKDHYETKGYYDNDFEPFKSVQILIKILES